MILVLLVALILIALGETSTPSPKLVEHTVSDKSPIQHTARKPSCESHRTAWRDYIHENERDMVLALDAHGTDKDAFNDRAESESLAADAEAYLYKACSGKSLP